MRLSQKEIETVVDKGSWMFDFFEIDGKSDYAIYSGDGVDDLDRLIHMVTNVPGNYRLLLDLGLFNSVWKSVDLEDLISMRNYVVASYGSVNKIVV